MPLRSISVVMVLACIACGGPMMERESPAALVASPADLAGKWLVPMFNGCDTEWTADSTGSGPFACWHRATISGVNHDSIAFSGTIVVTGSGSSMRAAMKAPPSFSAESDAAVSVNGGVVQFTYLDSAWGLSAIAGGPVTLVRMP